MITIYMINFIIKIDYFIYLFIYFFIYGSLLKGDFSKSEKFNSALFSYLLMDFDLVFGTIREMMRRDKPYQKKLILVTFFSDIS